VNPCILLFGAPRSGTTWIGKLFDSHPDTLYRHEPDSVLRLRLPQFPDKRTAPRYRDELERFLASLPQLRSPKVVGKQPLFRKGYQSAAALCAYRASVIVAKVASRVQSDFPCPYRPTAEGYDRARLVWKSIESPGRLGVCIEIFPEARAIHLMRHPCGYVASVLRGQAERRFRSLQPGADEVWLLKPLLDTPAAKARGLELDAIERLSFEERMAWLWVLMQEKILADVAGCERVLSVRYEDVCAEPLDMTRRMFEFTGLDWHPQTERFVRASSEATNTDYYSVFKSSRESAHRWSSELEPAVIERVMRIFQTSSAYRFYSDDPQVPAAIA